MNRFNRNGTIKTGDRRTMRGERTQLMPISVVTKPTGASCNLNYSYCLFPFKELFHDQKKSAHEQGAARTIRARVPRRKSRQPRHTPVAGGESALHGIDFFKRSVELSEKYRRPAQGVSHAIQANGTLINDN